MTTETTTPLAPFHYLRRALNPYGKPFPWFQVVKNFPGGEEFVEIDFLSSGPIANAIVTQRNLKRHEPK